MEAIIAIRAEVEQIRLPRDDSERRAVLGALSAIAAAKSLRYALQLLSPSQVLAEVDQRAELQADDVHEAAALFIDIRASSEILAENEDQYLH
jgi:DNA helicase TIP49 (TBP-interacting protein)